MKTPKEILFERHEGMEGKLNAARRRALAAADRPLSSAWRDFMLAIRWHLVGLGTVWLLVFLLNLDQAPPAAALAARDKVPSAQMLLASLLKHRRELQELTETPVSAETPVPPARRSEIQPAMAIA